MHNILISLFSALLAGFRSRLALQTEILALRHQIIVLKRSVNRPKLRPWDRFLWIWLLRFWPQWRSAPVIVKRETVIAWHRKGFRFGPGNAGAANQGDRGFLKMFVSSSAP